LELSTFEDQYTLQHCQLFSVVLSCQRTEVSNS
jgi:hypothetical protein